MVRCADDRDYWCKAVNNPISKRIPVNEQIVARLGRLIGVSIPEPAVVRLDALVGWEFSPGRRIEPGLAHGCLAIPGALETRQLDHRADDDNRARHAGFFALMDWLAGGDQQWLYASTEQNAYYSHDHGHFFPGGPDWSTATLAAVHVSPVQLGSPADGLAQPEVARLADAIEAVQRDEIDEVMSLIPTQWDVADDELAALSAFISARAAPAAQRLRCLVL